MDLRELIMQGVRNWTAGHPPQEQSNKRRKDSQGAAPQDLVDFIQNTEAYPQVNRGSPDFNGYGGNMPPPQNAPPVRTPQYTLVGPETFAPPAQPASRPQYASADNPPELTVRDPSPFDRPDPARALWAGPPPVGDPSAVPGQPQVPVQTAQAAPPPAPPPQAPLPPVRTTPAPIQIGPPSAAAANPNPPRDPALPRAFDTPYYGQVPTEVPMPFGFNPQVRPPVDPFELPPGQIRIEPNRSLRRPNQPMTVETLSPAIRQGPSLAPQPAPTPAPQVAQAPTPGPLPRRPRGAPATPAPDQEPFRAQQALLAYLDAYPQVPEPPPQVAREPAAPVAPSNRVPENPKPTPPNSNPPEAPEPPVRLGTAIPQHLQEQLIAEAWRLSRSRTRNPTPAGPGTGVQP